MWNVIARSKNGEREDGEELKKKLPAVDPARVAPRDDRRAMARHRWRVRKRRPSDRVTDRPTDRIHRPHARHRPNADRRRRDRSDVVVIHHRPARIFFIVSISISIHSVNVSSPRSESNVTRANERTIDRSRVRRTLHSRVLASFDDVERANASRERVMKSFSLIVVVIDVDIDGACARRARARSRSRS